MLLIIYLIPTPRKHYNDPQMFDKFNNETGMDYAIIPNIVHYVIFNNQTIDFVSFLSIVSAIKVPIKKKKNQWYFMVPKSKRGQDRRNKLNYLENKPYLFRIKGGK